MRSGPEIFSIRRYLDRIRLLAWCAAAVPALARAGAVAAVAVALNALVIERLSLPPWAAWALSLCGTLGFAAALVRLGSALAPLTRMAAARRVQSAAPQLRNDVESSLELAPVAAGAAAGGTSRALVSALIAGTRERLALTPPGCAVSWKPAWSAGLLLIAGLVPLAALQLTGGIPAAAVRALADPRVYWPFGEVQLAVDPGDVRIGRGQDLVVRVRSSGPRPGVVDVGYEGATGEGSAAMERGPDGVWTWRFAAVTGDFRYRALAGGSATPWYRVRVADVPAAGNFEIVYTYPAYSGLGSRRVSGGGDLEALKGTTVGLAFSTTVPLADATLVIGANRVAARPVGERRYSASLYLNGETAYRLELRDTEGLGNGGGPEYAIRYLPDAAPTVEVAEPVGEIESDPRGTIAVRYRAADDYGLSRLALVARSAAGERRLPLPLGSGVRSTGGEYAWDLGGLGAAPGERVSAFVEAMDNDTIAGPKTSVSALFVVRIADPRARREETREAMDRLTDDLVQLLAEELDLQARYEDLLEQAGTWERFPWEDVAGAAARQQAAREAAGRAEQRADRIAEALERDPAAREESVFQADLIREGLAELRERQLAPMQEMAAGLSPEVSTQEEALQKTGFLAAAAEQSARKAEELALMAEALKRESGMADVAREAGDMAEAEDRLLAGLERLSPGDRKAAQEVLRQLDRIEQDLRELAEALLKENKELPEEFLNSDALENLDLGELLEGLDQVRELLRKGDIAGARRAARELATKLADLRNRLQQAAEEVDERQRKALERLRGSTVPQIRSLADIQRALLERTEALESQAGPRLEEALREMARAGSPAAPPAEADLLTPEERGRTDALAREQEGLRHDAQRLAAEAASLRAALPFFPGDVARNLEEAAGYMGEAVEQLRRHEPGRALPPERAALAALSRARDQAQQSLDDMAQMQGMAQGSSGMPMAMGARPSPGQSGSSEPSRGRRSGGRRGTDVRSFVIPGREDHRVPKIFREEILKSLRDGYPAQYEGRIKDYYQRIAE